jgi:murein DD-endopeptidase MepM/ murein hydrolase activator NlpD
MPRITIHLRAPGIFSEIGSFFHFLHRYIRRRGYGWFSRFEIGKDVLVDLLYKKRGKYARPFLHVGTISLVFLVITMGPLILSQSDEDQQGQTSQAVLPVSVAYGSNFSTLQAEEVRQYRGGEIIIHNVQEGETLSTIAERYGLQPTTIQWENELAEKSTLKPGQELRILPVDGVRHKVARGETIFSIGKKYGLEDSQVQVIVDYPFNEFLNNETFELATGQFLMIPDGVKPDAPATVRRPGTFARTLTPDAGTVTASGSFIWPASGGISQGYRFYHKAFDISNRAGGPILGADGGTIVAAGWDSSGYGNRIIVDHGNGYSTLYGHLSVIQVQVGQRVNRGDVIGQMGSTGRSTGTHLHFEVRQGGVLLNPGDFLR